MPRGKRSENGGAVAKPLSGEKAAQRIAVILAKVDSEERKAVVKRASAILRFASKMAARVTA